MRRNLTEPFIRALKPAPAGKRYSVTDTLVPSLRVRVTDKGTKSFVLWRRVDPRAASASPLPLGTVGALSLAAARAKAREWLGLIANGEDPRVRLRAERDATVATAVERYLAEHVKGQRQAAAVAREVRSEIVSRFGPRPLASIKRLHIVAMVAEIKHLSRPVHAAPSREMTT